jgi:glutamine synthetase
VNLMTGGPGPHGLTAAAEAFLAGALQNVPPLLTVGAPTVAGYLRIAPQPWSGASRCWGRENREAAIRLVARSADPNAEIKCLDGSANPYLLVGAVFALGLDRVARGLRLPPAMTVDPASLSDDERATAGVTGLPQSLNESLAQFRACDVLAEAMGPDLFDTIIAVREAEIARFADASEEDVIRATRFRY